ncbi:cupin domain-containing protein, partial [bacterium]
MRSPLFEGFDYEHDMLAFDTDAVRECEWDQVFASDPPARLEFPLYLRRERYNRSSEIVHRHNDFLALYIVRGGRGTHIVNEQACSMARGDVFIMGEGAAHYFRNPIDLTLDAIYFQARLWSSREWEILCGLPELTSYLAPDSQNMKAPQNSDHFGHLSPEPHTRVEAVL